MTRLLVIPVLLGFSVIILFSNASSARLSATTSLPDRDIAFGSTITVHGVGSAEAPAVALTIHLVLEAWDDYGPGPSASSEERLQPVVDAAIEVGVEEDAIEFPAAYAVGFDMVRMSIRLDDPTEDQVQEIFSALDETTMDEEMYVVYVGGYYEYDDCPALESEALSAAFEDAQDRAERLASVMEAELLDIISVTDETRDPSRGMTLLSSCDEPELPNLADPYSFIWTQGGPPFDPGSDIEVRHVRVISVVYAVE
jgi:hypothetical protein